MVITQELWWMEPQQPQICRWHSSCNGSESELQSLIDWIVEVSGENGHDGQYWEDGGINMGPRTSFYRNQSRKTKVEVRTRFCVPRWNSEWRCGYGPRSEDVATDQDIKRRISLACILMQNLNSIWKTKEITKDRPTKKGVCESLVLSVAIRL